MDGGGDGVTGPMVTWLRAALDATERNAKHSHHRGCDTLGNFLYATGMSDTPMHETCDCDGPRSALARVEAERMLLDEIELMIQPSAAADPADASLVDSIADRQQTGRDLLRVLAYGHRYDMEGYDPAWAPEGVAVDG